MKHLSYSCILWFCLDALLKKKILCLTLLSLLLFSYSHAQVKLFVSPAEKEAEVGDVFAVEVKVESGERRVDGANVFLAFDPSVLEVVSAKAGGALGVPISPLSFNNETGEISYAYGVFSDFPSGAFNLFTVTFRAMRKGVSGLDFVARNGIGTDLSFGGGSVLEERVSGRIAVGGAEASRDQAITFPAIEDMTYGDAPVTLNATSSSGLAVSYQVISGPATVSGNTLTILGAGDVIVRATQAGNSTYAAATPVDRSFAVAKASQAITFSDVPDKTLGDAPFVLEATSSSGLPVSFSVVSGPATVSGSTVTLTGVGAVVVRASQGGSENYNSATPVEQSFDVSAAPKQDQTITFAAISDKNFGDAPFTLSAEASSVLPVSYRVVSGPATVSGNTITLTGAGTVVVEAVQGGNDAYNAASPVRRSFTVNKAPQSVTFATVPDMTFGDDPVTLEAIATSGLPVTFQVVSGPATVSDNTLTVTGAGTVRVRAVQTGNANYQAGTPVEQSIVVEQAPQTISFAELSNKTFGDAPFTLSASATSGLPVSYSVVSGPATISGNTVTLTVPGTVTIRASQPGNTNYQAAPSVDRSFSVLTPEKQSQTITFAALPDMTFGDGPVTLNATASSGLPVSFSLVSGPATLSGNTLTLTGAGTVIVQALQSGNDVYNAAPPVQRSIEVERAAQIISFAELPDRAFGDAPFTLSATASSGLPVSYSVVSGPATVSGSTIKLTGPGTVTIRAVQAGSENYMAAAPVVRSFNVTTTEKQSQAITFAAISDKAFGDAPFTLSAEASSGLTVDFDVVSGPATISGNTITLTGAGTVVVEATQAGNDVYSAAPAVQRSFEVEKASQSITFAAIADKPVGAAPFALNATASSGLPISYSVKSGPATVEGNILTLTGAGTVVVEASQGGNENYMAAESVRRNFNVQATEKQDQYIYFTYVPQKTFGDAPFAVSAEATSGLPVRYRIVSGPGTISGNTVTITGAGIIVVEAYQEGNEFYKAVAQQDSIIVMQAPQIISFDPIPDKVLGAEPFSVSATSSSGMAVDFSIKSGPATVTGNTITITGTGKVVIEAAQGGSEDYLPAASVEQSFTVSKAQMQRQAITFPDIPDMTYGDAPFTLSATASSGLPVSFEVVKGPATISGNTVTLNGVGRVKVRATQKGNNSYTPAAPVLRHFVVHKAFQAINFTNIGDKTLADSPFELEATASSGLPITFSVVSGPATVSGRTVTLKGIGTVTVKASQGGNENFKAATAEQSFKVALVPLTALNWLWDYVRKYLWNLKGWGNLTTESTELPKPEKAFGEALENPLLTYPNPFFQELNIEFMFEQAEDKVVVEIFTLHGKLLETLHNGRAEAGVRYFYTFNGEKYATGMYLCRMTYKGKYVTKRLVLAK